MEIRDIKVKGKNYTGKVNKCKMKVKIEKSLSSYVKFILVPYLLLVSVYCL